MTDRFAHLSGSAVLDALNTVDWRLDPERAIEQLVDIESVLAWCSEAGQIDAREQAALSAEARRHPRRADAAARRFREAREDLVVGVLGTLAARQLAEREAVNDAATIAYAALVDRDPDAIGRLAERQKEAYAEAWLVPEDGQRWAWREEQLSLQTPTHRMVRSLVELMRSDLIALLHQCEDDVCGWVYLDTSPRRNRRWCAASDCGDRNRARAYYRRHKDAPP